MSPYLRKVNRWKSWDSFCSWKLLISKLVINTLGCGNLLTEWWLVVPSGKKWNVQMYFISETSDKLLLLLSNKVWEHECALTFSFHIIWGFLLQIWTLQVYVEAQLACCLMCCDTGVCSFLMDSFSQMQNLNFVLAIFGESLPFSLSSYLFVYTQQRANYTQNCNHRQIVWWHYICTSICHSFTFIKRVLYHRKCIFQYKFIW